MKAREEVSGAVYADETEAAHLDDGRKKPADGAEAKVHARVADSDDIRLPVGKGTDERLLVDSGVALAERVTVEAGHGNDALVLSDEARRLRPGREAEEDDDGQEQTRAALDEEEDAPLLNRRALHRGD